MWATFQQHFQHRVPCAENPLPFGSTSTNKQQIFFLNKMYKQLETGQSVQFHQYVISVTSKL